MKKIILIFFISALTFNGIYAQDLWTIKTGINFSSFTDEDNEKIINGSFGLNREISIYGNFSLIPELLITKKGGILRNKPVKNEEYERYLYSYTYKALRIYLDIPLLLAYSVKISPFIIKLYAGPSYSMGLGDKSERSDRKLIYDEEHPERKDEFENYEFECIEGNEYYLYPQPLFDFIFRTTGWALTTGFSIQFRRIVLDLRYTNALYDFGQLLNLFPISKSTHTFHLLFGIKF